MKMFNIARRQSERRDLNPPSAAAQSKSCGASGSVAMPSDAYVAQRAKSPMLAALRPTASQPSLNWKGNLEKMRSRFGVNGGTHFVSEGNTLLAVKWAPTLGQEIMAYHL
ncbi:MAG: hypothetical protein EOO40_04280, partial [Deltaproteobacteria bacterium]